MFWLARTLQRQFSTQSAVAFFQLIHLSNQIVTPTWITFYLRHQHVRYINWIPIALWQRLKWLNNHPVINTVNNHLKVSNMHKDQHLNPWWYEWGCEGICNPIRGMRHISNFNGCVQCKTSLSCMIQTSKYLERYTIHNVLALFGKGQTFQ